MTDYLEGNVMTVAAEPLLQTLRNNLLTLLSSLDQLAAGDVKQRMAKVVTYMRNLEPDTRADVALRHICALMRIEDLAKRLYVHPHEARVVTKSIAGFIGAAEKMQLNLRQFSEWIAAADKVGSVKPDKHCVQLDCVRNAKGKEFEHVILPYLETGEFPFDRADPKEEDNLFYVAITRAISALTLISPKDAGRRSAFIERMNINGSKARAEAAVDSECEPGPRSCAYRIQGHRRRLGGGKGARRPLGLYEKGVLFEGRASAGAICAMARARQGLTRNRKRATSRDVAP